MARIRDVVVPAYETCGPAANLAIMLMKQDLDAAARAMAEGDTVAMIHALVALSDVKL
jgi:hypothetical protein